MERDPNDNDDDRKLEAYVRKAIEDLALQSIKTAAERAFPLDKVSYFETIVRQVLGPVTVASLILAIGSWVATETANRIHSDQQKIDAEYAEKAGVYQKYKEAHRERWNQGALVQSSLAWGFSSDIVNKRKQDYDAAYVVTNNVFMPARDYLGRVIVPSDVNSKETFELTIERLRKVTGVHDLCLTKAYGERNDWDGFIWADRIKQAPEQPLYWLKRERDCRVSNVLKECRGDDGRLYNTRSLKAIYEMCSNTIFNELDKAMRRRTSEDKKEFLTWKGEAEIAIGAKCSFKPALVESKLTEDCERFNFLR